MDTLRADAGVSAADWQARREVLERLLVRPLRTYQSQLLPEYLKEILITAGRQNPAEPLAATKRELSPPQSPGATPTDSTGSTKSE